MWEQEHSKAFVVNGQKFMEYVTEQWEMHRLEKERAKQERVSEHSVGRGHNGNVSSPGSLPGMGVAEEVALGTGTGHSISGPASVPSEAYSLPEIYHCCF